MISMKLPRNMPRYKCHKEVWALKIKSINPEQMPNFSGAICRGSYVLGTACGHCERCKWEREYGQLRYLITPEDDNFEPFFVDRAYVAKHDPKPGMYLVLYKDGYLSASPAEAFEEGYTRCE